MVHGTAGTAEREDSGLIEPSFRRVLLGGLPGFLREGFLPLIAFYAASRLAGLGAGIAASAAVSVLIYGYERRAGREGLLVRLALVFVVVQVIVGLLSHSTTAYLATPVLANAVYGLAFLGSAALRRPLMGALACAWYPFPPEFRATPIFKRVFGIESIVWGLYLIGCSVLRLIVLLHEGVGSFVVVSIVTGTPAVLALVAWSIWYTIRRFADLDDSPAPAPAPAAAPLD